MTAIERLIAALRPHHPDLSRFTVVSMSGTGRDLIHDTLHRLLGGLMPTVLEFGDYKSRCIAEATGRAPLPDDEAFLRFHALRCREKGEAIAPADTERMMQFLGLIARFSVSVDELSRLDRIASEQLERIDSFFAAMNGFRTELAAEGRFYAPFEEALFADLTPRDNELFVGLPVMTPAHERFFARIPEERRFIDAPLFGPHLPHDIPDYDTALALTRRIGIGEERAGAGRISFSELAERPAVAALIAREIDEFLKNRGEGQQLFIVPLDETLSFYLWELLFRPLGDRVNFVPWIPFSHFAAAHRLTAAIRDRIPLDAVRRELAAELTARWHDLDAADRAAFEGAIPLIDELVRLRPLMGKEWETLALHLINAKKLRLRGKRSAPVQVVGMGSATGIPYQRALILPMDRDTFPRKPFSGPFLNLIHLPRIHTAQFEADDLALRQFLAFGETAHIAARYDTAAGEAPSPHFAFLAVEFSAPPVKRLMAATSFRTPTEIPAIENSGEVRDWLKGYHWSFSSLPLFFSCPFRFLLKEHEKIEPPACFGDEGSAGMVIGSFLHRFFAGLKNVDKPIDRWRAHFEEQWNADSELHKELPDHAVRKAIVLSYLDEIAAWERNSGDPILFSGAVTEAEFDLNATFGTGYRLTGRIDRLQRRGGRLLVADLKYRDTIDAVGKEGLIAEVEDPNGLSDQFQLLFYAHLLIENDRAKPEDLDAAYILLRSGSPDGYLRELPAAEIAGRHATLSAVAARLDRMIAQEKFTPNYRADACTYCPYKAICLKPDLYRTGGRPW
ncbi:MAG TPA: PD-(D/E)XK nuclease family protein [bacterium]|nr:PD-(D/E)XK nuclease family protein [bacterium]